MEEVRRTWADRYAESFGNAALKTAETHIEALPENVKSHAFRFCVMHNLRIEDIKTEIAVMAFTVQSTIETLYNVVQAKDEFIEEIERAGALARNEIRVQGREIAKLTQALGDKVLELSAATLEMQGAGEAAYKNFKARVKPEELKNKVAEGALAVIARKINSSMDESVRRAVSRGRYLVNAVCIGLFVAGAIVGKYML